MTRPQAVETARRMWADGEGWRLFEIRRHLAKHGISVSSQTVHAWVDPEWAQRRNESLRASKRRLDRTRRGTTHFLVLDDDARDRLGLRRPGLPSELTPDLLLALRNEDGLTYGAIAAVARRFFGEDMTETQARFRLYELGAPKNPNKTRPKTVVA